MSTRPHFHAHQQSNSRNKWCPGAEFDTYPQRQFVTESININSLADHHIWSTIKTLPATLPEPSFKVQVSSAGVTGAVSASDLDVCFGVGVDTRARLLRAGPWLWDWRSRWKTISFALVLCEPV